MSSKGITTDEINKRNSVSTYWIELNKNAEFYRTELIHVLENYVPLGILIGQELLLHSDNALSLANDLEELGIAVLGFDCWYYEYGLRGGDDVGFYVGDDIIWGTAPIKDSIFKAKDFIQNHLPSNTKYVSFTLYIPNEWKLFPNHQSLIARFTAAMTRSLFGIK